MTVVHGGDAVDSALSWDAQPYGRILQSGYQVDPGQVRPDTAFFPLVSWLAGLPDLLMTRTVAMVLTANLAALAAFVAVWGAATAWSDERLGRASVVLLALWPASLFYWAFYSEAVFVAASAGAVWADRRGHRVAGVLLLGAALARSIGVLVGLVLVATRVWRRRRIDETAVLYGLVAVVGLGVVMYVQYRQVGDALAFVKAQGDWGRSLTAPWVTLREGIGGLKSIEPRLPHWLNLAGITAMGAAVLWCIWPQARRRRRPRLPTDAWLLTVAVLAFPLCSGAALSSMNCFVAGAWSGFVIFAAWLSTADRRLRATVYGLLAVASVFLLRYWAHGVFIG